MTDFWEGIAARLQGELPNVQPAIAPLYAPQATVSPLGDFAWNPLADVTAAEVENLTPPRSRLIDSLPSDGLLATLTRPPSPQPGRSPQPTDARPEAFVPPDNPPGFADPSQPPAPVLPATLRDAPTAPAVGALPTLQRNAEPIAQRGPLVETPRLPQQGEPSLHQASPQPQPQPFFAPLVGRDVTSVPEASTRLSSQPLSLQSEAPNLPNGDRTDPAGQPARSELVSPTPSFDPISLMIERATPPYSQVQLLVQNEPVNFAVQPDPVERQSTQRVTPVETIAPSPLVASDIEQSAGLPPRQMGHSEASASTIQVTIGRIEIRSTPPSTPRPKSTRPSPKLTLQDYLNQQGDPR